MHPPPDAPENNSDRQPAVFPHVPHPEAEGISPSPSPGRPRSRRWGKSAPARGRIWTCLAGLLLAAVWVAGLAVLYSVGFFPRENGGLALVSGLSLAGAGAIFVALAGRERGRARRAGRASMSASSSSSSADAPWSAEQLDWLEGTCAYYRALTPPEREIFRRRFDALAAAVPLHWSFDPESFPAFGPDGPDDGYEDGFVDDEDDGDDYDNDGDGDEYHAGGDPSGDGEYGDDSRRSFSARAGVSTPGEVAAMRIRVYASGVMLGFGFAEADWTLPGLREIVLRPQAFDGGRRHGADGLLTEYEESGALGEDGLMNGVMLLSAEDLAEDWAYPDEGRNVALHEFVHLVDDRVLDVDADAARGRLFERERRRIRRGRSELDDYALTDEREFLAVATECFFMAPRRFAAWHPLLYDWLRQAWRQDPAALAKRQAAH